MLIDCYAIFCVFKSVLHTFQLFVSSIGNNPFFSSALLLSPSTYTQGSIYSSYAMEFFFSIRVRFFNFLRFSSHWASKEHCVALPSNLSFFAERFLHGSVRKDFATSVRWDWYCIIDNRSTIDLKILQWRWPCGNCIVSINGDVINFLLKDAQISSRYENAYFEIRKKNFLILLSL